MRARLHFMLACLSIAVAAAAARGETVAQQLTAQLERHPVILLGEHHRSASYHEMLQNLLHDPTFVCRIDDVVIESGTSRFQATADRFVAGESVPRDEKVRIWRDTTQWLVWDSPVYERILDAVREVNVSKKCDHPIRVVLAEPAIPWGDIKSAADYRKHGERDRSYADIIDREVFARGRRALMVVGGVHVQKSGAREMNGRPVVATLLEAKYPGKVLSIETVVDPKKADLLGLTKGKLVLVGGTPIGRMSFVKLTPNASAKININGQAVWKPLSELTWPPIQEVVDGFIYLGDTDTAVDADPAIYREPAYQAELRRRAPIMKDVYGMDFLAELEELIGPAAPAQPSS